jgi:hypothetical protein
MKTEEEFWLRKKLQQQKLLSIEATNHLPSVDLQVETQAATYYLPLLQLLPNLSLSLSLSLSHTHTHTHLLPLLIIGPQLLYITC